ncbi:hypothetical protein RFEPED_0555 [Rickettsia felis str. Pedreira]|uniref:Uncharacterized protein n=1 Tax=Rickettsia felis str. Pedreira TaxID=1359196 RepID=A0A0F3MR17_RICFI|nr:hypothetical protein RFEPED_0555 [Rickettsia felis str. Pedreira]
MDSVAISGCLTRLSRRFAPRNDGAVSTQATHPHTINPLTWEFHNF